VTKHVVKEFNDRQSPQQVHSVFNLPFGMIAAADFNRQIVGPQEKNAQLMDFKCAEFVEELLYGAWRKNPLSR